MTRSNKERKYVKALRLYKKAVFASNALDEATKNLGEFLKELTDENICVELAAGDGVCIAFDNDRLTPVDSMMKYIKTEGGFTTEELMLNQV